MMKKLVLVALALLVALVCQHVLYRDGGDTDNQKATHELAERLQRQFPTTFEFIEYGMQDTGGVQSVLVCSGDSTLYSSPYLVGAFQEVVASRNVRRIDSVAQLQSWLAYDEVEEHLLQFGVIPERVVREDLVLVESFLDDTYPHTVDKCLSDFVFIFLVCDEEERKSVSERWTTRMKHRFTVIEGSCSPNGTE